MIFSGGKKKSWFLKSIILLFLIWPHEGSKSKLRRSQKGTLDDVSPLTEPAERGRYFLSPPSFTRKHQIRTINKHFSENDSKLMIQSGGQSVHNPVQQPCKRPEDGSLHCPWIPCQSKQSTRKKKDHLVCPIYARLWLAASHVGLPTHWKGGCGEAGDCPKARVASPVNQFSATSCRACDGGPDSRPPIWRLCHGWAAAEAVRVMLNIRSRRDYHVLGADLRADWCSLGFPFLLLLFLQTYGSYDK